MARRALQYLVNPLTGERLGFVDFLAVAIAVLVALIVQDWIVGLMCWGSFVFWDAALSIGRARRRERRRRVN